MTAAQGDRRVLLFTGHRVDLPDRAVPRFPAAAEATAREWIRAEVTRAREAAAGVLLEAIASGANGGDILFLEACVEHAIPASMYLALEAPAFVEASVADGGPEWVDRFDRLAARLPVHVLPAQEDESLGVFERTNLWMLETALALAGPATTLIALWNGLEGDGPGGTSDMVSRATAAGARFVHLDTRRLPAVSSPTPS